MCLLSLHFTPFILPWRLHMKTRFVKSRKILKENEILRKLRVNQRKSNTISKIWKLYTWSEEIFIFQTKSGNLFNFLNFWNLLPVGNLSICSWMHLQRFPAVVWQLAIADQLGSFGLIKKCRQPNFSYIEHWRMKHSSLYKCFKVINIEI